MADEKKILEHFAKILNVEVPPDPIKEDLPKPQPVLKKSFKDFAKEKKKKVVQEAVIVEPPKVPVTLFELIKEEMARTADPKPEEVKRPKTIQEHMQINNLNNKN